MITVIPMIKFQLYHSQHHADYHGESEVQTQRTFNWDEDTKIHLSSGNVRQQDEKQNMLHTQNFT